MRYALAVLLCIPCSIQAAVITLPVTTVTVTGSESIFEDGNGFLRKLVDISAFGDNGFFLRATYIAHPADGTVGAGKGYGYCSRDCSSWWAYMSGLGELPVVGHKLLPDVVSVPSAFHMPGEVIVYSANRDRYIMPVVLAPSDPAAVPEPRTLGLCLSSIVLFLWRRRQRSE